MPNRDLCRVFVSSTLGFSSAEIVRLPELSPPIRQAGSFQQQIFYMTASPADQLPEAEKAATAFIVCVLACHTLPIWSSVFGETVTVTTVALHDFDFTGQSYANSRKTRGGTTVILK